MCMCVCLCTCIHQKCSDLLKTLMLVVSLNQHSYLYFFPSVSDVIFPRFLFVFFVFCFFSSTSNHVRAASEIHDVRVLL